MFEDQSNLIQKLRNPMTIASMTLDELQNRLGGTRVIADPNSPFCHLLEMNSSLVANAIQAIDEKYPALYPQRATSMEDLYNHMSDFDYLRMYSTPSSTQVTMEFSKTYLSTYALDYNTNYKKVTIPKDTVFTVGKYSFGLYYPIDILINNFTKSFTVTYDTSAANPLHALTRNIIDKVEYTNRGLEWLQISFPIYQFAKSTQEVSLVSESGFAKKFTYNDKFYAIRLFSYSNGTYTELAQTQSKIVYDTSNPTALVRVLPDTHEVAVTIPQIYLDNGMLGTKLYIELYTTLGELHIDTTNISGSMIGISYSKKTKDSSRYSAALKSMPYDTMIRITGDSISGGTDAVDMATLRNRVVNDTLYSKVPITEDEIAVYLEDNNFYVRKYIDNVTDRIYYAYRIMQDSSGNVIPSVTMQTLLMSNYTEDHSTFRLQSDNTITILPTTLYRYNDEQNTVVPLDTDEMSAIAAMTKPQLVEELNRNQYFRTPFHIRINLVDYYPKASSYDLMTPSVDKIIFEAENYDVPVKMQIYEATINHLNQGVGGYRITVATDKSNDLQALTQDDIVVYIVTKSSSGNWIGARATYSHSISNRDFYTLDIATNYRLTEDNEIAITNLTAEHLVLTEYLVPLQTNFYAVFLVRSGIIEGVDGTASTTITQGVPTSYLTSFVALSRQYLTVTLGTSLDDVIKLDIETSSTSSQYSTWDHNEPLLYKEDVYERDENGMIATVVDEEGNVTVNKIHAAGEQVRDSYGNLVWKHKIGDVRYDAAGEPIVAVPREKIYYLTAVFIDAKVFASERSAELNFVADIYNTLEGYFTTLRALQNQLLERTYIYFRAVRSTGTATFNLGNGVTTRSDIELSFKINCYVQSYVKQDETIQSQIVDLICDSINQAIQTKELSMLEIFGSVKSSMSDYIDHFDLLGINGTQMQTFVVEDEDAQPSIARSLTLSEDNVISLSRNIDITFIALENNTSEVSSYEV